MSAFVRDDIFDVPLTQEDLADALGLTPVHVNRMLQRLRKERLIEFRGGTLTILDSRRLCDAAGFNPSYLHPEPMRHPVLAAAGVERG